MELQTAGRLLSEGTEAILVLRRPKTCSISFEWDRQRPLGLNLVNVNKALLFVESVDDVGVLGEWNHDHPEESISRGSRLAGVNDVTNAEPRKLLEAFDSGGSLLRLVFEYHSGP